MIYLFIIIERSSFIQLFFSSTNTDGNVAYMCAKSAQEIGRRRNLIFDEYYEQLLHYIDCAQENELF